MEERSLIVRYISTQMITETCDLGGGSQMIASWILRNENGWLTGMTHEKNRKRKESDEKNNRFVNRIPDESSKCDAGEKWNSFWGLSSFEKFHWNGWQSPKEGRKRGCHWEWQQRALIETAASRSLHASTIKESKERHRVEEWMICTFWRKKESVVGNASDLVKEKEER